MTKVDVFELARAGGRVDGELEIARLARLAAMLARPGGRLRFGLAGCIDEHGRPAAHLDLEAELVLRCDRCGGEVAWTLAGRLGYFFVASEAELNALPIEADGDEALLGGAAFDVEQLVEDEAILQLPMSPRHLRCPPGAARGEDGVGTPAERRRPFEALAGLRGRRDKGGN